MKLRSLLCAGSLLLVLAASAGCGVIYSTQDYGSPSVQDTTPGATKADVFANLGQPNAVYKAGNGEAFFYQHAKGTNVLGAFSKIKREDAVVIFDANGVVLYSGRVDVGSGMTILSPPFMDPTHPVRSTELLFDPENYSYEAGESAP